MIGDGKTLNALGAKIGADKGEFKTRAKNLVRASDVREFLATGNGSRFISRAAVKQFILDWSHHNRYHPFSRVADTAISEVNNLVWYALRSGEFRDAESAVEELEKVARQRCREITRRNPSIGRTIR